MGRVVSWAVTTLFVGMCLWRPTASQATGPSYAYTLPEPCRGDLSDIPATVIRLPPEEMEKRARAGIVRLRMVGPKPYADLRGYVWINPVTGASHIFIRSDLSKWSQADVERHERCHIRMYQLTGDSRWHP